MCCFCWGTLHQQLPIHPIVLTTSLRCVATSNLLLPFFPFFFHLCEAVSFFPLAAKRFWIQIAPWWTLWVPTQWMWGCKLCEWRHFWCTPLFLTRFLSLWNKRVYQKCLSSSYPPPKPIPRKPVHTHPNFISIHQASQRYDKLHLNLESVEGLFLSAGSCQKPRHVTVPNARESQNHNLKTIYRWNVVILRWLGGENDCRSSQSSKLENGASSGTNKISF